MKYGIRLLSDELDVLLPLMMKSRVGVMSSRSS